MSGLKLVPSTPKWPSTMNGIETPTRTRAAAGRPSRTASPTPGRVRHSTAMAPSVTTPMTASAVTFSPGSRTVPQASASSSAIPTAGDSHDQCRRPQTNSAACPMTSEAPTTSSVEAYVPSTRASL